MRPLPTVLVLLALLTAPLAAADHGPPRAKSAQELAIYHTWPTLTRDLEALEQAHPELMTVESIGKSVMGLDLWGVHVAATGEDLLPLEARERVFIDGGTHANEQLGVELAYHLLAWLVNGYGEDAQATWVLENRDVYIVPMVNPDGNTRDTRVNTNLVDLNRNYPFAWGGVGTGDLPGDPTYRGPAPASEPEVQANIEAMAAFDPDYVMTYHTGITMFIHPWGANDTALPDQAAYDGICRDLAQGSHSAEVPCGNAEALLYPTTGATDDFAYGELGAVAITFEVDDEQFLYVSPEVIQSRLAEAWEATVSGLVNAHRYGNHPVLVDAALDGDRLAVTVGNDGYGDGPRNEVRLTDAVTGQTLLVQELGRLAANETHTVTTELPGDVERVEVTLAYDRVNWKVDKHRERSVTLDLARLDQGLDQAITADDGLALAPALAAGADLWPASTDGEATPAPGALMALAVVAFGALAARTRRR